MWSFLPLGINNFEKPFWKIFVVHEVCCSFFTWGYEKLKVFPIGQIVIWMI
jgi:hypothetical protein